jgi:hypothetical protein
MSTNDTNDRSNTVKPGLAWKPARLIAVDDVIVGDGGRFRVDTWEPVLPLSRIAMTLTDLHTGEQFSYTARWDDQYAIASATRRGGEAQ